MEFLKKYKIQIAACGIIALVAGAFFVANKKENVNNNIQQEVKQLPLRVDTVPVNFEISEDNELKAVFTNESEETILTFTLEVLLKDTEEKIELKSREQVEPGQQSSVMTGTAPASGNIDDVQILKYKISVLSGTYMEYDTQSGQYNWS
ncbi:hypothetical protein [uncultured Clostridium sp.]|uniref:hypothetical protein n=1 Tax=uncultured Clostridium sp. TaxID=59620 RepID=UPI0025EECE99|nr:hypothetical protein [uncultured Clostridium sp.]